MLSDNTKQLSDKAKELLSAAANGNSGAQVEFYASHTLSGVSAYNIWVGPKFVGTRNLNHQTYSEYQEAANELVANGLATEKFAFVQEREYLYELTSQGYRTAGLINRVGL